jgi:hypothetical protein
MGKGKIFEKVTPTLAEKQELAQPAHEKLFPVSCLNPEIVGKNLPDAIQVCQ